MVRLKGRPFDISLIQCYAPTADNNDNEVEKFYEQLDEATKQKSVAREMVEQSALLA